jgi:hypothetical protein
MLQYLLDDYLPGYHLPARRLSADGWSIDPITCEIKVRYYEVSYPEKLGNAVAMRKSDRIYDARYILCRNGIEYYVYDCERYYTGSPKHINSMRFGCRALSTPDMKDYLI